MIAWVAALVAGVGLGALSYGRPPDRRIGLLFALRAVSAALLVALLLNAPLGTARRLAPWVVLDASGSWRTNGGEVLWDRARAVADSLLAAGADSLLLFGDSLRGGAVPAEPSDRASNAAELVDAARALGRPLLVVTDGRLDESARLEELPEGSAVLVIEEAGVADAGFSALDAPTNVLGGDTIVVEAMVRAAGSGTPSRAVTITIGGRVVARATLPALDPWAEEALRLSVVVPSGGGRTTLRATLDGSDDFAPNDTAARPIEVQGSASAVVVSTSPDQDARFALALLRETRRGAIRGYWRVAPGSWRSDEGLREVDEATVRRAVAEAALVLLHGDTAYFGAPMRRTRAALVLLAGPALTDGANAAAEYYAVSAGDSPLRAALAELPWDSLPPIELQPTRSDGMEALLARRARRGEPQSVVRLREGTRRVAVLPVRGLWRWRLRGGRSADAYDALWGSLFDWVGAVRRSDASTVEEPPVPREFVPRRPTVDRGPIGTAPARDLTPRARGPRVAIWLALLAILALCGEWVLRRRIGWR